ncbi:P-loop containing nucleoside triphosphate hydrolase protein [Pavlovales sp. CCMP2436]|nr:P-loop containing nucleoside triphosphate hydrolase protein [Pavlovales sp. CCMP2436]
MGAAPAQADGGLGARGDEVGHRSGLRAQAGVHVLSRVRTVCAHCRACATGDGPQGLHAPVRGVLLHGPPGVGKTHLVRALAVEHKLPLVPLDAARLGKEDASVARGMRAAFAAARGAARLPALVFADELDALCEARATGGAAGSAGGASRMLGPRAASLCALLESLPADGRVLFVGATNRLHALDSALLRSGRIECALPVALGTPDERAAVLASVAKSISLAPDVDLGRVARALCHGFSQADCAALCRGAALIALRRAAESRPAGGQGGEQPSVRLIDFEAARAHLRPTVLRGVELAAGGGGWETIGGVHEAKLQLQRAVEWPLTRGAALRRLGVGAARGVLLHGPPGCSKTLLARAVAASVGCTFLHLSGAAVYSPFVGEAEATLRATFATAAACAPTVLFLDELDALVGARGATAGSSGADGVQSRVLSTLLTELDGIERVEGVVLIGATNRLDLIDSALLRPGRLDVLIRVGLPTLPDRAEVLRVHTVKMPLARDNDLDALAARADGLSAADLAQLCVQAALCALKRGHAAGALADVDVTPADFSRALTAARPSVVEAAWGGA